MLFALVVFGVAVLGLVSLLLLRFARYVRVAKRVRQSTKPFMYLPADAVEHMIILGDSTMYSAGATKPAYTIGGLLSAKCPKASIETLAVNGAKASDLAGQLKQASFEHYKVMLVGIGGNDVVRLTRMSTIERELAQFFAATKGRADLTVLCHSVNVGNIGFFPFPLNIWFDRRSKKLSQLYYQLAEHHDAVTYVNFYRPRKDDHYNKKTRRQFLAEDGFHANNYANEYFFDLISKTLPK